MSGWEIGDLAVCVDNRPWVVPSPALKLLRVNSVYRVIAVVPPGEWRCGYYGAGLVLEGALHPRNPSGEWFEHRFRKIRPDAHEGSIEDWRDLVDFFTKRVNA